MTLALNARGLHGQEWIEVFKKAAPNETLELLPNVQDPDAVDVVLSMSELDFPSLNLSRVKCVVQLGHGVDGILKSGQVPKNIPIVRLDDETITAQMTAHALAAVLYYNCRFAEYAEIKRTAEWKRLPTRHPSETKVGIIGIGRLGRVIANRLADLGFAVEGWSRSEKTIDHVAHWTGENGLRTILANSDVVMSLLPATADTSRLLNRERLSRTKKGAFLINLGRGATVNDADLIAAIDGGQLSGAYLDVFDPEPLPSQHPFWAHPKIMITPHVASETRPTSCVSQILENVQRLRQGLPLHNIVDRDRGY